MINKVTITGADDSVTPSELVRLSNQYPFVEWGILVSRKNFGRNRFPSFDWLQQLIILKIKYPEIKLSCHLCGQWVRDILMGDIAELSSVIPFFIFDRVQINTHGERHDYTPEAFSILSKIRDKEFIFQYDEANDELLEMAKLSKLNYSALFDLSHGVGKLPSQWGDLLPDTKCGYAGGLGHENLADEIPKIEQKAGDAVIWIDMETKVRSHFDEQFDVGKVESCLKISRKKKSNIAPLPLMLLCRSYNRLA